MAQQLLDGPDVIPLLNQVGCKAVPQRMDGGMLDDARRLHRIPERFLQSSGIEMVPLRQAGDWINGRAI